MTKGEIFGAYVFPVIVAALTALAGFLGTQIKGLYQKYINDKTKEAVVRTCVKAVEQLYHDLNGSEKFEAAKKGGLDVNGPLVLGGHMECFFVEDPDGFQVQVIKA